MVSIILNYAHEFAIFFFLLCMLLFFADIFSFLFRMRDRFSSTLSGTGAPAGAGRKKRSIQEQAQDEDTLNKAIRILQLISEANEKYNSQ